MRTTIYTIAAAAAMLVGLACDGTGSGNGGQPPPGRQFACDMRVPPRSEPHTIAGTVFGGVHVDCNPVPTTHNLDVWLERDAGHMKWIVRGEVAHSIVNPDATGFTRVATASCEHTSVTHKWRVRARAAGIGPADPGGKAGTPFLFYLPERESVPIALYCA